MKKIYVISRGRYADGNYGWQRNRAQALDFQAYYGYGALDMAVRHAEAVRAHPRCRGNQDARAIQFLHDEA